MTGIYIALVSVSFVAALALVGLVWEDIHRRAWKEHDGQLERQVAFDEALLDRVLGPRRAPDVDDPTRGTR